MHELNYLRRKQAAEYLKSKFGFGATRLRERRGNRRFTRISQGGRIYTREALDAWALVIGAPQKSTLRTGRRDRWRSPNAETPAHRVDDDGRRNIERLGCVLDVLNTATPHANQDSLWLRRDFIRELGSIIASLGVSLAEAAWRGGFNHRGDASTDHRCYEGNGNDGERSARALECGRPAMTAPSSLDEQVAREYRAEIDGASRGPRQAALRRLS